VYVVEAFHSFCFDCDSLVDEQIRNVVSDRNIVIDDLDGFLLLDMQT